MSGLPENTPALARQQAELADLRWVAGHLLAEHARLATPYPCLCPVCSRAGAWVKPQAAIPHPHILPRCPVLGGGAAHDGAQRKANPGRQAQPDGSDERSE